MAVLPLTLPSSRGGERVIQGVRAERFAPKPRREAVIRPQSARSPAARAGQRGFCVSGSRYRCGPGYLLDARAAVAAAAGAAPARFRAARSSSQIVIGAAMNQVE